MSRRVGLKVKLVSKDGRVLRHIYRSEAEGLIEAKCARGVYSDKSGELISIYLTNRETHKVPTASGLGLFEMQANVGLHGEPLAVMGDNDPITEIRNRVLLWPFIGDSRAIRVMPRVSDLDVQRAIEADRRARMAR